RETNWNPIRERAGAHLYKKLFLILHRVGPCRTWAKRHGTFCDRENTRPLIPIPRNSRVILTASSCACRTRSGPDISPKTVVHFGAVCPTPQLWPQFLRTYWAIRPIDLPACLNHWHTIPYGHL